MKVMRSHLRPAHVRPSLGVKLSWVSQLCLSSIALVACGPEAPGPLDDAGRIDARVSDAQVADADILDADLPADGGGDGALSAQVDRLAAPLVDPSGEDATRAVGVTVVVVSEGRSAVFGYGALRAGETTPPDGSTCFPLGSVSKVFTGLLLASSIESPGSTLGPDDLVNGHLAADIRAPDGGGVAITLEHLVSHYSGLPNFPDNLTGPPSSPAMDYSRAQLSTFLSGFALERDPGSLYDYSNLGSGLLGVALADSAGLPDYDALLRQGLTEPLGMGDTGTNLPAFVSRIGDRLVQPYQEVGGSLTPVDVADMGVLAGGGEVLSTGDDVLLFLRAMTGLDAFPVAGAVERAITVVGPGPPSVGIAYALNVSQLPDGITRYEKAGRTAGSTVYISFRREPAVGVAVLSNRGRHMAIRAVARNLVAYLAR